MTMKLTELPAHCDPQCILVSNLHRRTIAETLNDTFSRVGEVDRVEIDLDEQHNSKGSAIILFSRPLQNYDLILSRLCIDDQVIQMEFAPKGFVANHPWRDSDSRSDRVWVHARSLSLGTMLAPKTYVSRWTCVRDVNVMFDYGLRCLSVYFLHLGRRYRIDSHFGDIDGGMKMECEGNTTHLTFSLRCPTRVWREKIIATEDGGARPDIRATNKQVYKTWERTLDIPLDADAERCIQAEPKRAPHGVFPSFASHRVNLAAWLTIRFKFEPEDWMRKDLNTMIASCTEFNLIPPNFNHRRQAPLRVLPASQLDTTHTHERRAQRIQDFDVLYYLECAISQGIIDEVNLEDEIYDLLNEAGRIDPSYPRGIMMEVLANTSRVWKPYDTCYNILSKKRSNVGVRQAIPDHCVPIRKIIVTPTTMYLQAPTIEVTNRVVRHFSDYADRFIRVQFVDEGTTRISATFGGHSSSAIYARIYKVLQHGIQIGRRRYDFLAFSSSQLRGHGCWFFAPTRELTCNMIRAWMGTFDHVKVVAKNAVRMGQCFSTTIPTILLKENQVDVIDDIERNGYTFSDGVGKIAPSLARDVAAHLQLEATPSCIQFRLGGAKGLLALSNFLSGKRIQLRPSQIKFDSAHTMLEVIRTSTYLPAYLNRQAITLLSALGVKDPIFMRMTEKMVNAMNYMLRNPSAAIKLICQNMDEHGNANTMARIIGSGFLERSDPYIINMLNVFRVSKLKDLKEKARIHVPNGAFLLGILDDTGSLEEGEIYVRISNNSNDVGSRRQPPIVGPCVIFRNPCFHPGDVRVVTAVDKPALRHLFDVVVFSSKGFRDLPSMLSGGDLDGDDYTVIWDETLLPPRGNHPPLSYQSDEPLAVDKVKIPNILKFFVNYIDNDNLGQIANAHLAISDRSPLGAMDGRCRRLAELHSRAVDFPKTGRPAKFDADLRISLFPDFMQKPDKDSYKSEKILGRIYRHIDASDYEKYRETLLDSTTYDTRMWVSTMEEFVYDARETRNRYNRDISALMNQFGVYTEAELVSGYVMEWKKRDTTRKSTFEQTKQVVRAVKQVQSTYRKQFSDIGGGEERASKSTLEAKAAAWYYVTYHPHERSQMASSESNVLFSFPWVVYDILCDIAVRNTHRQVDAYMAEPLPEDVIQAYRPEGAAGMRVQVDSDDDNDAEEEDYEEEDEEEEDDDDDNEPMVTFRLSDIKRQVQEQQRRENQPRSEIEQSLRTLNLGTSNGNYVEVGAKATDEQLEQVLTL